MAEPTPGNVRIRAVFGLGNPGSRYEKTRHNAGFLVLEHLRRDAWTEWKEMTDREEASLALPQGRLLLARPLTFMNRSGLALERLLRDHGLESREVLVVLDDVSLPEGRLRIRPDGGPGGHKGLVSILEVLGTDAIPRLRIGVGSPSPGVDLVEFVLESLEADAWLRHVEAVEWAAQAVLAVVEGGLEPSMNRFNPPMPDGLGLPG